MIRFSDKVVSNGRNRWMISGIVRRGGVDLDLSRVHGDIADEAGLRCAVERMLDSRARYRRVIAGGAS